jgi:hypothetical protein
LNMEEGGSSETSVTIFQTTRSHIPEDNNMNFAEVRTSCRISNLAYEIKLMLFHASVEYFIVVLRAASFQVTSLQATMPHFDWM